ncbi:unnamed protein product [Meloidogyne enterolobii]|uniref:Uncharacterized protein n=1 Tax=Meloidogyne enterolobii TaxID=390850 RepID=A0ACB1AFU2_MELEN
MEFVVALAFVVLVAVFFFSLWMLVVTCQRRNNYKKMIKTRPSRFSNLKSGNNEDVAQLGPNMLKTLNDNQWIDDFAAGLLQNCVAVLRLCHSLTERMLPLEQQKSNQYSLQIDKLICEASGRLMPNFESLLYSMAAKNVDIRVLEARVNSLVSASWALAMPICLANLKQKEPLEEILNEMNAHLKQLQIALDQFEEQEEKQQIENCKNATKFSLRLQNFNKTQNHVSETSFTNSENPGLSQTCENVKIRIGNDEEQVSSLLPSTHEQFVEETAPADPAITK